MEFTHLDASRSFVYGFYDFMGTESVLCLQCVRRASRIGWHDQGHDTESML
jgi:hypothetical protein